MLARGAGIALLLQLAACGGGGGGTGSNTGGGSTSAAPTLTSIAIAPPSTALSVGAATTLTAKATYSDGSTSDVSTQAAWSNSDAAVLELGKAGTSKNTATGLQEGTSIVTATFGGLSANLNAQVGTPVVSIKIYSFHQDMSVIATGSTIYYAVYAKFQSNVEHEATASATWSSSDPSIAAVSMSEGHTVVTGLKPGTVTLTVSVYGKSEHVPLTVSTAQTIAYEQAGSGFQTGRVALASSDDIVAVWSEPFSGSLFGTPAFAYQSSYSPSSGWSATNTSASFPTNLGASAVAIAANTAGVYARAWSTREGVFASRWVHGQGWLAPQQVYVADPLKDAPGSLQLAVDSTGNSVLMWSVPGSNVLYSSVLLSTDAAWSAATLIPGAFTDVASPAISLAINSQGEVAIAWERWSTRWTTFVSKFSFRTGWSNPTALNSWSCSTRPHIAMNDLGDMVVAGTNRCPTAEEPKVFANRYSHVDGWQPVATIVSDPKVQPANACAGINNNGDAVLVWGSDYDGSIFASNFTAAGNWTPSVTLITPSGLYLGTPVVYPPAMTSDGRAIALWLDGGSLAASSTYSADKGWQPWKRVSIVGAKFFTDNLQFAFDKNGKGVVVWSEYYEDANKQKTLHDIYADRLSF